MPNMTNFEFGQVVLVRFPFTDQHGSKQRPAVVISNHTYNRLQPDVILMAITSQVHQIRGFCETNIQGWQAAGLLKPSTFKPVVFTVEKAIVKKTLGKVEKQDHANLLQIISSIVGAGA